MKRMVCFLLTLILAFSMMGVGFASSNMMSSTNVQTSKVSWGISKETVSQLDQGADQTCDHGLKNARAISEGKDVATTDLSIKDTNKDGNCDTVKVNVDNAYPCYYNRIMIPVKNIGEIPVTVGKALLSWGSGKVTLEDGLVYYLRQDGALAQGDTLPDDAVLEIRWTGNCADDQQPGDALACSLEFHILPGACQNYIYYFEVTLAAEAAVVVDSIVDGSEETSKVLPITDSVGTSKTLPRTGQDLFGIYFAGAIMIISAGAIMIILGISKT